jgi:CAAX protease family protein
MLPDSSRPSPASSGAPGVIPRLIALLEVIICSDYPTQIALGNTFAAFGLTPIGSNGALRLRFVVALSLTDAALLVALIMFFLYAHGERPRDVFLGRRPVAAEIIHGVPHILWALAIGIVVLRSIQAFAPWLHTVAHNPLQGLIRSPRDAWLMALVVVIAGGVREELQRAFLLRRFEVWLGGPVVGVIVASAAFGVGHLLQGADAAIGTALLGAFWAIVYLRRRSVIAPMVSHAGFDLLQVAQFLLMRA